MTTTQLRRGENSILLWNLVDLNNPVLNFLLHYNIVQCQFINHRLFLYRFTLLSGTQMLYSSLIGNATDMVQYDGYLFKTRVFDTYFLFLQITTFFNLLHGQRIRVLECGELIVTFRNCVASSQIMNHQPFMNQKVIYSLLIKTVSENFIMLIYIRPTICTLIQLFFSR